MSMQLDDFCQLDTAMEPVPRLLPAAQTPSRVPSSHYLSTLCFQGTTILIVINFTSNFCINRIIQYALFSVWLLSLSRMLWRLCDFDSRYKRHRVLRCESILISSFRFTNH